MPGDRVLGDGVAAFGLIREYRHDTAAALYAFDLCSKWTASCGACRSRSARPSWQSWWSLNPHDGGAFNEHHALDGAIVFEHACALGCEGIVSKRLGSPYPGVRAGCWIKVKNPVAPAVRREAEEEWGGKRNGR